jgi:hypothetical protein
MAMDKSPVFFLINVPLKPPNYGIWCMPTIHHLPISSAARKIPRWDFPATELLPIWLLVDPSQKYLWWIW